MQFLSFPIFICIQLSLNKDSIDCFTLWITRKPFQLGNHNQLMAVASPNKYNVLQMWSMLLAGKEGITTAQPYCVKLNPEPASCRGRDCAYP